MQREEHIVGETFAYRFKGENPNYAIVISHGLGGHGGIYDQFCCHHAAQGADIWSYDAPGHGRSTPNRPRGTWDLEEWAQASRDLAAHVKKLTGLPVFLLGSSLGAAAASSAIDSDDVTGVIVMGSAAIPASALLQAMTEDWRDPVVQRLINQMGRALRLDIPLFFDFDTDYGYKGAAEQKKSDPLNTWSYDLASWVSIMNYQPPIPAAENKKPILFTAGSKDPNFPPATIEAIAGEFGDSATVKIFEGAPHQLMLFETQAFSTAVDEFCRANI